MSEEREIYNQAYASGKMPKEVRDQQLAAIIPHYESLSREQMNDIKIDASLAAIIYVSGPSHGYEKQPIGGFEVGKISRNIWFRSRALCPGNDFICG